MRSNMALKGTWKDKVNGVDYYNAEDINAVANAVIELEDTAGQAVSDFESFAEDTSESIELTQTQVVSNAVDINKLKNRCFLLENATSELDQRVTALEAVVCLEADTQILMADGTTKSIKDVNYGDMVKSWDLENGEYIDVKSYGSIKTGIANKWKRHIFSNGETLKIFGNHTIYNATRNVMLGSSEWKTGEFGMGLDGEECELTWVQNEMDIEFKARYILLTENSLYFANGILSGHHPKDKLKCYSLGLMTKELTEEEIASFRETAQIYENNKRINHVDYIKEVAPILGQIEKCHRNINRCKNRLTENDYKTVKRQQGKLSDEEWDKNVLECEELRRVVNESQSEPKQHNKNFKSIKEKHGLGKVKNGSELFYEAYNIEMNRLRSRNDY